MKEEKLYTRDELQAVVNAVAKKMLQGLAPETAINIANGRAKKTGNMIIHKPKLQRIRALTKDIGKWPSDITNLL